jgi:hypothetical protein
LQRQRKNLKDNLKKCLDKRQQMTKSGQSGAAASSLPQCKYFEQMKFLHEKTYSVQQVTPALLLIHANCLIQHSLLLVLQNEKGGEMLFPPSSSWQCGGPFGW